MSDLLRALTGIPKIELHAHLEGTLDPEFAFELAVRNKVDLDVQTSTELREKYKTRSFRHFLTLFGQLTFLLATPVDFEEAVVRYARTAAEAGAIYVELTVSLGTHVHFKQLDPIEILEALARGAETAEAQYGIVVRFILDHVRSFSIERCAETVEWCRVGGQYGVVGLGLGGPEQGWPASAYDAALLEARRSRVSFVPHAGEAAGPESVWDALNYAPVRIGHGLAVADDPGLMSEFHTRDIMIEVCPSSNVCLGHVSDFDAHPARKLWDAGIPVSINTDDPPMFRTSLLGEYRIAHEMLGFSIPDLVAINRAAIRFTLAGATNQRRLERLFEQRVDAMTVPEL